MLKRPFLFATALAVLASSALADEHLAAGADLDDHLILVNAGMIASVYHMLPEPAGRRYAGYYALGEQPRTQFPTDYFGFIALASGVRPFELPAETGHAKTGADIWMEITSVSGPAGASFGFWESRWARTHSTPTVSFLTGQPTNGYKFEISEPLLGYDDDEQDPYGHIHDRGWTASQPGDYYIGFTLYDLSDINGDGPLHTPSQVYILHFQAVPEPAGISLLAAGLGLLGAMRRRSFRFRSFAPTPIP